MPVLDALYKGADSAQSYVNGYKDHYANMVRALDTEGVAKAIEMIEQACADDKTIFLMANGGSAAVAGHWVNDLSANSVREGQPGFRVMSLTDNAYSITALANDASFDEIFAIQLKAAMRPGDLVMAMSVSGNSPNLVRGMEYANENGAHTIVCTGMEGGRLKGAAELTIHTPSSTDEYGPVEDMFSVFMHIITGYLTMKRGRPLFH
ncbi:MAG: SIS domain-containing protein [Candidatus Hydrogenedentes bacterium]|jgi:D-sedoheptulose 7-phosphate isomerase|nr:SIS domain-containing protein [Candidatus Hydrogenedentota bacterium]